MSLITRTCVLILFEFVGGPNHIGGPGRDSVIPHALASSWDCAPCT